MPSNVFYVRARSNNKRPIFLLDLPILASSFCNLRYAPTQPEAGGAPAPLPRDEPPFLDTDLGRATVLLGAEDFAFYADEFGFQTDLLAPGIAYVVMQLLEFGGDHLDALMRPWPPAATHA